ncbi:hypothetical protein [Algibacter sp. 2305UL17-15]|uniref:hypothetical protein n=1 Tax=Algibacter sp. 2305UL17-15 TaxID=3231268 RepID=UPI00345880C5
MKTFKNLIAVLGIILLGTSITSCTAESIEDQTEIATDGDKKNVIPDPDED